MKSARSYSDHEIACYVLGLDGPDQARDIQARLAQDDVAAACALKWETCFLSIVDALPPAPPPDELLLRIRASLDMEDAPIVGDARSRPPGAGAASPPAADDPAPGDRAARRRRRTHPRLNRSRLALVAAAVVLSCVAVLVVWASLRPTTSRMVQQSVQLQAR